MSASAGGQTYYFRAGAPEGGVFLGQLRAASADEALGLLRQKGFQPLRLELRPIRDAWFNREISVGSSNRLTTAECESFCRELALLLASGIAVMDAIAILLPSQRRGSRPARFATALRYGLRLGRSLSQAIESSDFRMPTDFLPVMRAGEETGLLPAALTMLAESYADANRFARAYSSALAYPALLLCVSILVFGLIAFLVAPNLASLFTSMDRPVPFAISALAGGASFVGGNLLATGVVMLCVLAAIGGASAAIGRRLHAVLFRVPFVGDAMRWSASRRFAATLRLYLSSNVPVATALPNALISAGFPGGPEQARRLADRVRGGARLSTSLDGTVFLPPKLIHMIAVGESGGRMVEVLGAVVTEAKNRFEQRMALVSALLAPILILIVGFLIGTVIFSVFSALLDINEVVL